MIKQIHLRLIEFLIRLGIQSIVYTQYLIREFWIGQDLLPVVSPVLFPILDD